MSPKQFTSFVDIYSDRLFRYVIKQGVPNQETQDIMQNCFEALWKSNMQHEEECGKYLFGIAHNQCANYWRTSKRNIYKENLPEQSIEKNNHQVQNLLHQILLQLPSEQRSLILLKDYEGYSYEEISNITQLNITQVKVYLHRARLVLKEKIGNIQNII